MAKNRRGPELSLDMQSLCTPQDRTACLGMALCQGLRHARVEGTEEED